MSETVPSSHVPSVLDPDSPLRIAYLTYRGKPHVGGQGVYTRHLTKALVDLGHSVEVYSGQPYPVVDERVAIRSMNSSAVRTSPPIVDSLRRRNSHAMVVS